MNFKPGEKIRVLNEARRWDEEDVWEDAIYIATTEEGNNIYINSNGDKIEDDSEIEIYDIEEIYKEKLEDKELEIRWLKKDVEALKERIEEIQSRCKHEEFKEVDKSGYISIGTTCPGEKPSLVRCECKVCGYEADKKEGEYEPTPYKIELISFT